MEKAGISVPLFLCAKIRKDVSYIKQEQLSEVFETQIERCRTVLHGKAAEYTGGNADRLCGFKAAAAMQGCTSEQALAGMLAKHIVSIYDMCGAPQRSYGQEVWAEKITDSINYLILLKALIMEGGNG